MPAVTATVWACPVSFLGIPCRVPRVRRHRDPPRSFAAGAACMRLGKGLPRILCRRPWEQAWCPAGPPGASRLCSPGARRRRASAHSCFVFSEQLVSQPSGSLSVLVEGLSASGSAHEAHVLGRRETGQQASDTGPVPRKVLCRAEQRAWGTEQVASSGGQTGPRRAMDMRLA